MPLMLIVCFLLAATIIFEATIYMNEKRHVAYQEQTLQLDWLLRNGEREWIETKSHSFTDAGTFHYPDGKVTYLSRYQNQDTLIVHLEAENKEGVKRNRSFHVDIIRESIEKEEEDTLKKDE